jgi:branched-chain amino acid transport system permease protein
MATRETAVRQLPGRRLPPASSLLLWAFGAILIFGVGYWLIGEAIDSPSRFVELTLIGLTNGMIYALVALGYTLVYGIIELINFAHGDNFMLGTFQTH